MKADPQGSAFEFFGTVASLAKICTKDFFIIECEQERESLRILFLFQKTAQSGSLKSRKFSKWASGEIGRRTCLENKFSPPQECEFESRLAHLLSLLLHSVFNFKIAHFILAAK